MKAKILKAFAVDHTTRDGQRFVVLSLRTTDGTELNVGMLKADAALLGMQLSTAALEVQKLVLT